MCLIASFNKHLSHQFSVCERMRQTLMGGAQKRFFSSFQVRGDLGQFRPKDLDTALMAVDLWAKGVKESADKGSLDKLQIFVRNEFSMYSAEEPAKAGEFKAILERFQAHAKNLPVGVLWCPGTIPYETGEVIDGLKAAFNAGLIFEGGTGDMIVYNKMITADVDGWNYSVHHVTAEDGQSRLVRVRDPNGGADAFLSMRICLEFNKYPVEKPFPQLMIVTSKGTGPENEHVPNLHCQLLLCNFEEPYTDSRDNLKPVEDYGIYINEPTPLKLKLLKKIESAAAGEAGMLGGMLKLLLNKCSQSTNQLQEWLERPEITKVEPERGFMAEDGHHAMFMSGVMPLREVGPADLERFLELERKGKFMEWRPKFDDRGHHGHGEPGRH